MFKSITEGHVNDLISKSKVTDIKMGDKTTVVCLQLPNGFEMIQSSACVDVDNYDHNVGVNICMERIRGKIYELEGYLLQNRLAQIAEQEKAPKHPSESILEELLGKVTSPTLKGGEIQTKSS